MLYGLVIIAVVGKIGNPPPDLNRHRDEPGWRPPRPDTCKEYAPHLSCSPAAGRCWNQSGDTTRARAVPCRSAALLDGWARGRSRMISACGHPTERGPQALLVRRAPRP